ncbi:MAG TPA: hypothetical protein VF215_11425 [Thermoanaerobaculia bacterium]
MHRRLSSVMLRIAATIVVALHAGLLWQRIEDLSITEPDVIARWCAAAIVAAVALLLLHLRVSWRSWLVFGVVVVLLHAALPIENVRLEVLIEAVFALAPLILLWAELTAATPSRSGASVDQHRFAFLIASLTVSLPSRAPPSR